MESKCMCSYVFVLEILYQTTAMYSPVYPRIVSWVLCYLSYLLMIFLKVSTLQLHSYLLMIRTKCFQAIKSSNDVAKLQNDIDAISSWSHTSNILFNKSKFVHLCFWQKPTTKISTYTVNDKSINMLMQHKDWGINFTNDLLWSKHYEIITAKAYQTLGLICRTFKQIFIDARKQLYISLVRSQLLYCSPLWRPQLL